MNTLVICLLQEVELSSWKLKRKIDGLENVEFVFPAGTLLKNGEKLKVSCRVEVIPILWIRYMHDMFGSSDQYII